MNKTIFENLSEKGIFQALSEVGFTFPWGNEITSFLDIYYLYNITYNLVSSNLLEQKGVTESANVIKGLYQMKWQKLYDTMTQSYNPIENYNMTESGTNKNTLAETKENNIDSTINVTANTTHTGNENKNNTGTQITTSTTTYGKTDNTTSTDTTNYGRTDTTENSNKIYGYNSVDPVPDNTSTNVNTAGGTDVRNNTIENTVGGSDSVANNRTDNLTENIDITNDTDESRKDTRIENESYTLNSTDNGEHSLKRSGNIGVTTTQQMLESERTLWLWNYFGIIFRDINRVLSLPVYKFNRRYQ